MATFRSRSKHNRLYNPDLAPVPAARRTWRVGSFAALWISMSACIPTYMLASSLIGGGMNWWQAVLTIFLGNLIVVIPMILNAHAGTRLRHSVSGFLPRLVRHPRRKRARAAARLCRLRLVRHPDLDRRRGDLQNPRRFLPGTRRSRGRDDFSASRFRSSSAFCSSGASTCASSTKASIRSGSLLNIKAPLLIALGLCSARVGLSQRRRLRTDPLAAFRVRSRSTEGRAVLDVLRSGPHRHDRLLGDALAQHSGLLALRAIAARSNPRPGARLAA